VQVCNIENILAKSLKFHHAITRNQFQVRSPHHVRIASGGGQPVVMG